MSTLSSINCDDIIAEEHSEEQDTLSVPPSIASTLLKAISSAKGVVQSSTGEIRSCRGNRKRRRIEPDAVDQAILDIIGDKKCKKTNEESLDEESLFVMQIAAKLTKLSDHNRAVAQIRIQEVLLEVEFGYQYQKGSQHGQSSHSCIETDYHNRRF